MFNESTAHPRLIRLPEVLAMTGLGRSTIYDGIAAGTFPAPVKLSVRAVAWRLSELEADAEIGVFRGSSWD